MSNRNPKILNELTKKERKILRTRTIILNAAKDLFAEKRFRTIKMEDIAESSALSRATLYNYFNTKEEIYFTIGVEQLKIWIDQYQSLSLNKSFGFNQLSGKELILVLAENLVKDILEFPHYSKLLRRFFYRSKELDLDIESLYYGKIIENKKLPKPSDFSPQQQIYIELFDVYSSYRELWKKAIEIGIKDGSIKSQSNPSHLNFIMIMMIFGLLDQIDFRRSLMKMVDISNEQIVGFILNLVKNMLDGVI